MHKIVVGFASFAGIRARKVDLGVIGQIKTEAFENSKVMDHLGISQTGMAPTDRFTRVPRSGRLGGQTTR